MPNNKNSNEKKPGEKEPGTFHYNPGNMSGKTIGAPEDESERRTIADQKQKSSKT
jgi:hypothetical protein